MRTKQIIQSAMINLMQEKNFFNISVSELAREAGISRTGFYNHYDSVFDVLQDIEDNFIAGIESQSYGIDILYDEGMTAQNQRRIEENVRFLQKNIKTLKALCGNHGDPAFQVRMQKRTLKQLYRALSKRTKWSDLELRLVCEFMAGGQWYIYRWCAFHENEIRPEKISKILGSLYYQVIKMKLHF